MARVNILPKNEVKIGDTYFPTVGPVRVTNISVTPNPVIFGETSQQGDTQVLSQLVQESVTGGSGIYKGNPRTDAERSWKSRAETRYRGFICLPPEAVDMGVPSAITSEPLTLSIEFRNIQYFAFATKFYSWLNATAAWSALARTLGSNPTDAIVFRNALYIACGTSLEKWDGTTWSIQAVPATYFTIWDTKLWRLAQSGLVWTIYWSTDGAAWTAAGEFLASEAPTQLLVYRDVVGSTVIYVMTETGPYIYDATNTRFLQSDLRIPKVEAGFRVQGQVFRDAKLYFTSGGLGIVSAGAGNPFVASPVGLDQDDGVPAEDAGNITAIAADFNWLLALIDSSESGEEDDEWTAMAGPFESWDWTLQSGPSTLRAWQGGWHVLWESESSGAPGAVISVSSAYGSRRIYWAAAGSVYYMDVPTQVHNPRHNPTRNFARGPVSHITPWWSYGVDHQNKIHGHFLMLVTNASATEKVTVYYASDLDDSQWVLLDEITADGQYEFAVGGPQGLPGRFFRFRIDLERGTDHLESPFVEYWSSEFMRLLPASYAYGVEIDLTKSYKGKKPAQLLALLKQYADPDVSPNFIQFSYQDEYTNEPQTHYGRISRMSGQEYAGSNLRGESSYLISFIVPYKDDSE